MKKILILFLLPYKLVCVKRLYSIADDYMKAAVNVNHPIFFSSNKEYDYQINFKTDSNANVLKKYFYI